ncbi:MAG: phosphate ABC transporter permease PstA [Solirubrobacteraceae bacterium]
MSAATPITLGESAPFDPSAPLTPSGNLRRRSGVNRFVQLTATAAALAAVAVLMIVVVGVAVRGAAALSLGFVIHNSQGLAGGGIANDLLGTLEIALAGAVIAVPLGILTGLYLTEFAGARSRTGRILKLALDMMQGIPTIVVGLFVYGLIVIPQHKESGFAGAVALSIVMLPLIARASQEVLLLVPSSLREAADALGVNRWRTVLTVILPAAVGGLVTGAILAIARAVGETAPLLICDGIFNPTATSFNLFGGVPSVPMFIYQSYDLPLAQAVDRVWAAALVLMVFILLANIGARVVLAHSRAKMGQ